MTFTLDTGTWDDPDADEQPVPHCPHCGGKLVLVPAVRLAGGVSTISITICENCLLIWNNGQPSLIIHP
jgi:hypothetical protein